MIEACLGTLTLLAVGWTGWFMASKLRRGIKQQVTALPEVDEAEELLPATIVDNDFRVWYVENLRKFEHSPNDPTIDPDFYQVQNVTGRGLELMRAAGYQDEDEDAPQAN